MTNKEREKKIKGMLENYQKAERNPYLLTIPKRSIEQVKDIKQGNKQWD